MFSTTALRRAPALARVLRTSTTKRTIVSMVEPAKVRIHEKLRIGTERTGIHFLVIWPEGETKCSIEVFLAIRLPRSSGTRVQLPTPIYIRKGAWFRLGLRTILGI